MLSAASRDQLLENLDKVLQYESLDIIERRSWGDLNFKPIESDLKVTFNIVKILKDLDVTNLTQESAANISSILDQSANCLARIDGFTINQGDPQGVRNQYCNEMSSATSQLINCAMNWTSYLSIQRGDFSSILERVGEIENQANSVLTSVKKSARENQVQMDGLLTAMREAVAEAGVGAFNQEFQNEAKRANDSATKWLKATCTLGFITTGVAVLTFIMTFLGSQTGIDLLGSQIAKWSVLVVLGVATIWSGRMYRAMLHQKVLNTQKALGLQSFQAFINATDDPVTKDAVLLATTDAIFGISPTGMIDQKTTDKSGSKFIELNRITRRLTGDEKNED